MNINKIKNTFARNYHTCDRALSTTNSENIKQDLFNRLSQTVLIYSELFELSIFEAEDELKFFSFGGNSE